MQIQRNDTFSTPTVNSIIQIALAEDIGTGDVTGQIIPIDVELTGRLLAKANGVIAGLEIAAAVFHAVDSNITFIPLVDEGTEVDKGELIATLSGPARSILAGERVALNLLQRMSGIASMTRLFVDAVSPYDAVILDTRKTVPGLRTLDKYAVRTGGGRNHRFGLFDMALIKENHIAAAGGIAAAVAAVERGMGNRPVPIEVEVTNLSEFREALSLNVDRIMLDNMPLNEMRIAVALRHGNVELEASGNVTLDTVNAIAATGVDFISSGALTHSVKALDISLLLDQPSHQ